MKNLGVVVVILLLAQFQESIQHASASTTKNGRIQSFRLFNTDTQRIVRVLKDNDVISVYYPFTIIAKTDQGPISHVTFTHPFKHVERKPHFSITRKLNSGAITALKVLPGLHKLSAFAGSDRASNLTIMVSVIPPGYPN